MNARRRTSLLCVGRRGEEAAEREADVSGDFELLVCHGGQLLGALGKGGAFLQANQALRDVQGQVDEHAISRPLDLKVLEEHVGLEEAEHLES